MSRNMASRTVTLRAPSIDKTTSFTFNPFEPDSHIIRNIRIVLGADQAWAYNIKHQAIIDFYKIKTGATILIATDYFECPLAKFSKDVLIVQDAAERAWMALSSEQKRDYIQGRRELSTTAKIYLTLPFADAQEMLNHATASATLASSLATIEDNWALPLDAVLGFQGLIMPYGEMEDWDKKLVPTLAVLSEATVGQGYMVGGLMIDAVKARRGKILDVRDVVDVGKELYRKAIFE
jgi:hypothetical protein